MKFEVCNHQSKTIAFIYFPSQEHSSQKSDRDELIFCLSSEIHDSETGYAGFNTKDNLNHYLRAAVFDETDNNNNRYSYVLDVIAIKEIIADTLKKCFDVLDGGITDVFVFPTFSKFVLDEMSGTTGYTPWSNVILIFINIASPHYLKALGYTVGHEFNHAVFLRDKQCESLADAMVFEGVADHFREQVIGGEHAPWTKILTLDQTKSIFSEMKLLDLLQSTDQKIRHGVFFGNAKYVRWTGYAIGYHIIQSFLKNKLNLRWKGIMTLQPKDILSESDFF